MYQRLSNYTYIILIISIIINNTILLEMFKPLILLCSYVGIIIILISLKKPKSILKDNLIVDILSAISIKDVTGLIISTILVKLLLIYILSGIKANYLSYLLTILAIIMYVNQVNIFEIYDINKLLRLYKIDLN